MEWMLDATPRPLYPRQRSGTHFKGDRVGSSAENLGIRSPERPARSESLYRPSYRGPQFGPIYTVECLLPVHEASTNLLLCPEFVLILFFASQFYSHLGLF